MKTEQHLHHHNIKKPPSPLSAKIIKTAKPTAYFILLLLTYTLGCLSRPSSTSLPPPPLSSSAVLRFSINTTELDPFRVTTRCADPLPPETVRRTLIDLLFNGTSPFHDFPPEHAAGKLRRSTKVKGWGSNGAVFENLIRSVKPRIIVEVGTFLGASALHMAELTRQLGLKTQILCIDDFRGWAGFRDRFKKIAMVNGDVLLYYQFLQNVVTFNQTESVLPIPFSSGSALMKLCEWGVLADLVEIDAGHDFLSAWSDINRGYRILRPGGVIFGHDYFTAADNRGVRRAVDLFARIHDFKVKIDGQHWVIHSN
ncbi:S-adenosyl-L-methionine-dependent methyltransferase [Sesbania bispinosa]|nr:S-adenosyl-L-methionine-dependent methyltransferase [Sesbania bispinosa]